MPDQIEEAFFGKGAAERPGDPLYEGAIIHEMAVSPLNAPVWIEKNPADFDSYPIKDQANSGSCVSQTLSKEIGVDEMNIIGTYRNMSARSIYCQGFLPGGGMDSKAAANIVVRTGVTLEALLPSDGLGEAEMENGSDYFQDARSVALVYRPQDYIWLTSTDLDTIASILQHYQKEGKRKIVGISVIGKNNGTWLSEFPKPPGSSNEPDLWYHRIAVTDFGLIGGKKFVSFDNSWGLTVGLQGKQFLGEEYQPFMYSGGYTLDGTNILPLRI